MRTALGVGCAGESVVPIPSSASELRPLHCHAWVLESLALAHGVELPANPWPTAKQRR